MPNPTRPTLRAREGMAKKDRYTVLDGLTLEKRPDEFGKMYPALGTRHQANLVTLGVSRNQLFNQPATDEVHGTASDFS